MKVSVCVSESQDEDNGLRSGNEKVRWCWWVAAAKAYPQAEEKEPMGYSEQGHRAGRRGGSEHRGGLYLETQ